MTHLFFKGWDSLIHIAICSVIAYLALFLFVRISGKRTLAKLTAFDFVVTVTLGSTLSSMILATVSLTEGAIALMLIIFLQFVLAWTARTSSTMQQLINSTPTLLFYDGQFLQASLKKEVITEEEVFSEIRKSGIDQIADVKAVVMELNGEFTVVRKSNNSIPGSSLADLNEFTVGKKRESLQKDS